jgi:KAP family P-loop domain
MAARPNDDQATAAIATSASVSPNSVSDQPSRVDTLGFKPYVEAVAVFLNHPGTHPPLTMSVEGAWGSGKSSFMLQLEDRIRAKGGKTVWFNAWRHDKEDELWAAFALDFTSKLAATLPRWKRWLLHLKLSYLRFDWQEGWFQVVKFAVLAALFLYVSVAVARFAAQADSPFHQFFSPTALQTSENGESKSPKLEEILLTSLLKVGGLAGYLLLGFVLIRKVADIVGNPLEVQLTKYIQDPKYETRSAFVETFHADFDRLVRTYAGGHRVFVFVDDLDRCEVPKAAELMQAINLLISESAPVFYVLGLDREKIAAGLAAKYEKLLPYLAGDAGGGASIGAVGTEFGYTYLEKFIQLPFLVPQPAEKDVDKLLDSLGPQAANVAVSSGPPSTVDPGLLVSLSTDSSSVREVVKMVAPSFDYNPRRLKQFVNLFRLRALLASQTGLFGRPRQDFDPLTFEQLGKLVAIILRWPLLLVDVESRPNLLSELQGYAWGVSKPALDAPPLKDVVLEFWRSKRKLMELISFPSAQGQAPDTGGDIERFGLGRIDMERFLQVSPLVRGRENADPVVSAAVASEARATATGSRPNRTPSTATERESEGKPNAYPAPSGVLNVNAPNSVSNPQPVEASGREFSESSFASEVSPASQSSSQADDARQYGDRDPRNAKLE